MKIPVFPVVLAGVLFINIAKWIAFKAFKEFTSFFSYPKNVVIVASLFIIYAFDYMFLFLYS